MCDLFRVDYTKIFKREGDCVRDIVLIGEGGHLISRISRNNNTKSHTVVNQRQQ